MNQRQKIIKIYKSKKVSEIFDKERKKYLYQRYKHKVESDFLKKAINSFGKNNIKILDIGCGTGRMLPIVFSIKKKIDYTGLDTSKSMTNELKKKAKKLGIKKKVKIKINNASKLQFKNNEFDIVFTYHLLWHLPYNEQEKIIKEMSRVSKKEGIIIFDILNKKFVWEKTKVFFGKKKVKGLYKMSIKNVKKILGKVKKIEFEKLLDAPIKNDNLYKIFNSINKINKILPDLFYHMIYVKAKK